MTRKVADLPVVLIPHPHVRVDRAVLGGSPYVDGSRVPVRRLWTFYRGGAGTETLVRRYPKLGAAKIFDALAFAWDNQEVIEADIAREAMLLEKDGGPSTSGKPSTQMTLPFDAAPFPRPSAAARPPAPRSSTAKAPAAKTPAAKASAPAAKAPAAKIPAAKAPATKTSAVAARSPAAKAPTTKNGAAKNGADPRRPGRR